MHRALLPRLVALAAPSSERSTVEPSARDSVDHHTQNDEDHDPAMTAYDERMLLACKSGDNQAIFSMVSVVHSSCILSYVDCIHRLCCTNSDFVDGIAISPLKHNTLLTFFSGRSTTFHRWLSLSFREKLTDARRMRCVIDLPRRGLCTHPHCSGSWCVPSHPSTPCPNSSQATILRLVFSHKVNKNTLKSSRGAT